ncbi:MULTISPECIES: hypothetical protein [unclassified Ensifer]|uniref:hypothetical protein n=1 Tax=unclassified Ensifer TaxID=2633371 RepID=UPI0007C9460F|nr:MULTISPECIES: hypothetical protein [unclassified Ensifer]
MKAPRPNPVKLQAQCDAFNGQNAVGATVRVKKDSGEIVETTTRSRAEVLSGHSAVIWLEGISGCYLLNRVRPVENAAAHLAEQQKIPGKLELFEGKLTPVIDASRSGWWRFHEHYDRHGYCDNPGRGY